MPAIQAKRMNWIRTPSPWETAQAWRLKRRAAAEQFQNQVDAFVNGVAVAQYDLISGTATISAQMALTRIAEQTQAKLATVQSLTVNKLA
jgi:hypothetical protein